MTQQIRIWIFFKEILFDSLHLFTVIAWLFWKY